MKIRTCNGIAIAQLFELQRHFDTHINNSKKYQLRGLFAKNIQKAFISVHKCMFFVLSFLRLF